MEDPTSDSYALKMYSQRKASIEITPSDPQFLVQYVGKTEVFVASGKGCTHNAVQKIWDNYYDEKGMKRVSVLVNSSGMVIKDTDSGKSKERVVSIKDIAYCSAERGVHNRIFSWIMKDSVTNKLECHAVLASSAERAQLMSLTLHRSFHVAYKDWKQVREKKARVKANKKSTQSNTPIVNDQVIVGQRVGGSQGSSQDSESMSGESDGSNEGGNPLMETMIASMNIVEEEEISPMDNHITLSETQ